MKRYLRKTYNWYLYNMIFFKFKMSLWNKGVFISSKFLIFFSKFLKIRHSWNSVPSQSLSTTNDAGPNISERKDMNKACLVDGIGIYKNKFVKTNSMWYFQVPKISSSHHFLVFFRSLACLSWTCEGSENYP